MDRRVLRMVASDRTVTSKVVVEELELNGSVSARTIRRRIREGGYQGGWANKKPLISIKNRRRRVQWCKDHLHWTAEDWKKIIWSDESPYTVRGTTKFRVWRRPNERYTPDVTVQTLKHQPKINVWGCFSASGVGNFHRIEGTMTGESYKSILIHQLPPSVKKMFPAKNPVWSFQQDNDPKHRSKVVLKYLDKKGYDVLDWPSQSPDLNPIENLWAIIEYRLRRRICRNEEELFQLLQDEWNTIDPALLESLVESMPRRCQAVIDANGMPTKY
jgi:hypothetical protein